MAGGLGIAPSVSLGEAWPHRRTGTWRGTDIAGQASPTHWVPS